MVMVLVGKAVESVLLLLSLGLLPQATSVRIITEARTRDKNFFTKLDFIA